MQIVALTKDSAGPALLSALTSYAGAPSHAMALSLAVQLLPKDRLSARAAIRAVGINQRIMDAVVEVTSSKPLSAPGVARVESIIEDLKSGDLAIF